MKYNYELIESRPFTPGFKVLIFQCTKVMRLNNGTANPTIIRKGWLSYGIVPNNKAIDSVRCGFGVKARNKMEIYNMIEEAKYYVLSGKTELINTYNN